MEPPPDPPDPFDWSIDEVVAELCNKHNPPWVRPGAPNPWPEASTLETQLRNNHITGEILLTTIDKQVLKDDLSVKSLGHRVSIEKAIRYWQSQSDKYRTYTQSALSRRFAGEYSPQTPYSNLPVTNPYSPKLGSSILGIAPSGLGSPRPDQRLDDSTLVQSLETSDLVPASASEKVSKLALEQDHPVVEAGGSEASRPDNNRSDTIALNQPAKSSDILRPKKRPAPTLVSDSRDVLENIASRKRQKVDHDPNNRYLGARSYTRTDFYRETPPPSMEENEAEDDFNVEPQATPHGQRLALKKLLHRHLNGVPRDDVLTPLKISRPTLKNPLDSVAGLDVEGYEHLLQRYPAGPEEDPGLPLYEDSGSENGFDSDTIKEIDQELADKVVGNPKNKSLTEDEVKSVIEESIANYRAQWQETKLPLVERKAYRLWNRATKHRHRGLEMAASKEEISRFDTRLDKLYTNIAANIYHKVSELQNQCQSMELSVFQREEQLYFVKVLANDQSPPKPPPRAKDDTPKVQVEELPDGEEIIQTDSDESEDSIDDFIVPEPDALAATTIDTDLDPLGPASNRNDITLDLNDHNMAEADTHYTIEADDHNILGVHVDTPDADDNNMVNVSDEKALDVDDDRGIYADDDSSDDDIVTSARKKRIKKPITRFDVSGGADTNLYASLVKLAEDSPNSESGLDLNDGYQDSDLDLPVSKYGSKGRQASEAIDLTFSSDPLETADEATATDFEIRTPELNPVVISTPKKLKLKLSSPTGPGLDDLRGIAKLDYAALEQRGDSKRLVIKMLGRDLDSEERRDLLRFMSEEKDLWPDIRSALKELLAACKDIASMNRRESRLLMRLAVLYTAWVNCKSLLSHSSRAISSDYVRKALSDADGFDPFCKTVYNALKRYEKVDATESEAEVSQYESALEQTLPKGKTKRQDPGESDRGSILDDSEMDTQLVNALTPQKPKKKRVRAVKESQEALDIQKLDRKRVEEQDRRQAAFERRYDRMQDVATKGASSQPVSFGDPPIFLDEHIGGKIMPHQLHGVQFMWREVVEDTKQQGCLLAHTMGLGKTMQVISLLVTISLAAKAQDEKVKAQVPEPLRIQRTLILCPPSLIDNWWDEFLIWTPQPTKDYIGDLRKIPSAMGKQERLANIAQWYEHGGVLIMSFDLLRQYIHNKRYKGQEAAALTLQQHEKIKRQLLSGPSIVIADEAHKMKNLAGQIAKATSQFTTKSRVALTGSPLANNLEEYYAMIEWIAPGYLGEIKEFRAKYSEPIKEGLYSESTPGERRRSLKKLQVLKQNLDPKVNRADITVLAGSLPSKTEFFLTVPLTEPQKKAYRIVVKAILGEGDDVIGNAQLWKFLAILSLLCNHPQCFVTKLEGRRHQQSTMDTGKNGPSPDDTEDELALPNDPAIPTETLTDTIVREMLSVFDKLDDEGSLDDMKHSHRVMITMQIIQASIATGDKVLLFSHSIPTLNYLQSVLEKEDIRFCRLDGSTKMSERQAATKNFNSKTSTYQVFLISIRAGGLGLNLFSANRVIIFDFAFNPQWEEQAVGRAYRLGQKKAVFVYRFKAGGTYEDVVNHKAVFKTQLSSKVVDKKNPIPWASKSAREYLFPPKTIKKSDLTEFRKKDVEVLDRVLEETSNIYEIGLTETFLKEGNEVLSAEDEREIRLEVEDERFKRNDFEGWTKNQVAKAAAQYARPTTMLPSAPPSTPRPTLQASSQSNNRLSPYNPNSLRKASTSQLLPTVNQYSPNSNKNPPMTANGLPLFTGSVENSSHATGTQGQTTQQLLSKSGDGRPANSSSGLLSPLAPFSNRVNTTGSPVQRPKSSGNGASLETMGHLSPIKLPAAREPDPWRESNIIELPSESSDGGDESPMHT